MSLRRKTREVLVGSVGVGGLNPIRVQSMTNSPTKDVEATVQQVLRLWDAGCEIVRVTVQGMQEAEACEKIKNRLVAQGCTLPLVADIHFFPPAAMRAADFVEKIRINPGNFADKRAIFQEKLLSASAYAAELERIEEKFAPLVEKCRSLRRALRIGTNLGSLSDRIMSRFGDTPRGMVESALEFARICRKRGFHDLIFSMKASNPKLMVEAYRLLIQEMDLLGWDYPLHLGVTEAGDGRDGRVKSAMGIGALLLDGLGDTIRVSLTEDPWEEMGPCRQILQCVERVRGESRESAQKSAQESPWLQGAPCLRERKVPPPPLHRDGTVWLSWGGAGSKVATALEDLGFERGGEGVKKGLLGVDGVFLRDNTEEWPAEIRALEKVGLFCGCVEDGDVFSPMGWRQKRPKPFLCQVDVREPATWYAALQQFPDVWILKAQHPMLQEVRKFFAWLELQSLKPPVVLHVDYSGLTEEELLIGASVEAGALFLDGWGEGIWLEGASLGFLRQLSFSILQAARMRMSKTDFIACPSCGRTLFDLQQVNRRIQERTAHLPGVKIAIMGCIVNGPGEMADADFGYVGSKPGKVDLYVGKTCVEKEIPFEHADDRLVALIQAHGRWLDP